MLKSIAKLECKVNDKVAQLYIDNDTPIATVREMLNQFMGYLFKLEEQAKAQVEAQKQMEAQAETEKQCENVECQTQDNCASACI